MTLSCSSQDRIIKQRYTSLADLEDDLTLLWENARTYNEESSQVRGVVMWVELVHVTFMYLLQIYSDSFVLERGFLSARAEIESGAYDFGASDDEQNVEVGGA